ncbi:MAG: SWIM zinc finger family protein [Pseudonocardia sp.]
MAVTRYGLTWWGRRWIAALEALGAAYENRLPRGRTYARRGAVHELVVTPGSVTARVHGSRPRPYRVGLRMPVFSDEEWSQVTGALAGQLRHAAALLDGAMPEDVDDTLAAVGLSLFPHAGELATTCSCPDVANPCKHVAAVHYVLAQTFDADPFLLPTLRGRDRAALLAGLRAVRSGSAPVDAAPDEHTGSVALTALSAPTLFSARGDLAAIGAQPHRSPDPTAVLRRLGTPPGFDAAGEQALADAVRRAAERAWQLAAAEDGDPLLVALRERGSASTQQLGEALGRPAEEVRAGLRALVADGLVSRTGHARSTRYHA